MPAEGLDWLPGDDLLTADELFRLLRLAVTRLGITSVRFTGGGPLLYRGLEDVIAATAALHPRPEIAPPMGLAWPGGLTDWPKPAWTGQRLVGHPGPGSLRGRHPPRSTGRRARRPGRGHRRQVGTHRVNAVLDPHSRAADAVELLRLCLHRGYQLRIIEQMPLDAGHQWRRDSVLTADDVFAALSTHFDLSADPAPRGSALPACGGSTAARRPWGSSHRCRSRFARPATAPA